MTLLVCTERGGEGGGGFESRVWGFRFGGWTMVALWSRAIRAFISETCSAICASDPPHRFRLRAPRSATLL